MNDEEKKAIEMLDKFITEHKLFNIKQADNLEDNIQILLNLIQNQQKEIKDLKFKNEVYKKKAKIDEKVIDEMAYQLAGLAIWDNQKEEAFVLGDVEEVKQYFYRKVENENVARMDSKI